MKDSPEVRRKLKEVVQYIFDPDNIKNFMRGEPQTLLTAEVEGGFEIGPKNNYPHCHFEVKTRQRGKLQINYAKVYDEVNRYLGHPPGKSISFDKVLLKGKSNGWLEYARKHGGRYDGTTEVF